MTADIELLPLPEPMQVLGDRGRDAADAWCRANVSHATAAKDAEIERLRAEREVIVAEAMKYAGKSGRLEAKVDRLAEALKDLEVCANTADYCYSKRPENFAVALRELRDSAERSRAALRDHDQEGGD